MEGTSNMTARVNEDTGLTPSEEEDLLRMDADILILEEDEDLLCEDRGDTADITSLQGSIEPAQDNRSSSGEVQILEDSPINIIIPADPSDPLNLTVHSPGETTPLDPLTSIELKDKPAHKKKDQWNETKPSLGRIPKVRRSTGAKVVGISQNDGNKTIGKSYRSGPSRARGRTITGTREGSKKKDAKPTKIKSVVVKVPAAASAPREARRSVGPGKSKRKDMGNGKSLP